jgi:hypothetical protein
MRRNVMALAAVAAVAVGAAARAGEAHAQGDKRNTLTFAPGMLLLGGVGLEYERALNPSISLTVAPDVRWASVERSEAGLAADAVGGASVGLRLFALGTAPAGLWMQPEVGAVLIGSSGEGTQEWTALPRLAGTVGFSAILADTLVVSAGAGLQFISVVPMPNLRFNLGFAF